MARVAYFKEFAQTQRFRENDYCNNTTSVCAIESVVHFLLSPFKSVLWRNYTDNIKEFLPNDTI